MRDKKTDKKRNEKITLSVCLSLHANRNVFFT